MVHPTVMRWVGLFAGIALVTIASGCSSGDDESSSTARRSTAARVVCNGDGEFNQDDDGAVPALLQNAQLPPGEWATAETPPCPWALSADELLRVPKCRAAAAAGNAPANEESRNGNARETFTNTDDVQLDDRIEIYTSSQNVDAIRAILASASMPACFTAALEQRATEEPDTKIRDVEVSRFTVKPDAAALGLSFPAVEGYDADTGFAEGVDVSFTRSRDGSSTPVAMRVITFGAGGLMSTITLIGSTPAELDAIEYVDTLRAAAEDYLTMVGPN